MTNEWYKPDENRPTPRSDSGDDNGLLVPIVIALGVGAAALILSSKSPPDDGGGGGGGTANIVLSGGSACVIGTENAQISLSWTSNTGDTDYFIERDGVIVETVRATTGLTWKSNHIDHFHQGETHIYRIIGKQSEKVSNARGIQTSVCTGGGGTGGNPQVLDFEASWS